MIDIKTRNFLRILRSGAFDESKPIGLLSAYKWEKIVNWAILHEVISYFATGVEHYYYDDHLNIPSTQIGVIREQLKTVSSSGFSEMYDFDHIRLFSDKLNNKLRNIIHQEYASMEKSYETMQLMGVVLTNAENMINGHSCLRGLIDLGRYLRTEGGNVDFVKLEKWLKDTEMEKMAELQGNLLISGFGFSREEIPFVEKTDCKAIDKLLSIIALGCKMSPKGKDWHEYRTGFVISNPHNASMTIKNAFRHFRKSPRESMAYLGKGLKSSLSEIEE